jgi:hypothetical protein
LNAATLTGSGVLRFTQAQGTEIGRHSAHQLDRKCSPVPLSVMADHFRIEQMEGGFARRVDEAS